MKHYAALLLLSLAVPAPEPRYFAYERAIENLPQESGQTCVTLEPAIFAHAASQLADLRLYRGTTETPYVIQTSAPAATSHEIIAPLNLGRQAGQTVFDLAMPAGSYSDLQLVHCWARLHCDGDRFGQPGARFGTDPDRLLHDLRPHPAEAWAQHGSSPSRIRLPISALQNCRPDRARECLRALGRASSGERTEVSDRRRVVANCAEGSRHCYRIQRASPCACRSHCLCSRSSASQL